MRLLLRWSAALASMAVLAATPAGAQNGSPVVLELRITSPTIQGLGKLSIDTARSSAEAQLVALAAAQFPYLAFVPASASPGAGGPRLIVELRDVVRSNDPSCRPRRVVAAPIAKPRTVEIAAGPELDFSPVCDSTLKDLTDEGFVDRVSDLFKLMLRPDSALPLLDEDLAHEVPLANQVIGDATRQRLFLPVARLNAKKESTIEVRFNDDANRYLLVSPFLEEGDRTQVRVKDFACDDLAPDQAITALFGVNWHASLPTLLANCGSPFVYMKDYRKAAPVESSLSSPTGSQPGIVTVLTGDGQ